ncbi:MAG: hypothetical protein ABSB19_19035, partial [Methylomonas sp.]
MTINSPVLLNQNYINNTLIPNYETVAFNTEDSNISTYLTTFSNAGGQSSASFGLFQFNVGSNPNASSFLSSVGFTQSQISFLSQTGLTNSQLAPYSAQLQATLQNSNNASLLQQLNNQWAAGLVNQLQNALNVIYQVNPNIANQIYQSQALQLSLMDYANQFNMSITGPMVSWLSGQPVNQTNILLTSSHLLTENDIYSFISGTGQGKQDPVGTTARQSRLTASLQKLFPSPASWNLFTPTSINSSVNSDFTAATQAIRLDPLVFELKGSSLNTTGISTTNPIYFDFTGN